jgi:zinc protease
MRLGVLLALCCAAPVLAAGDPEPASTTTERVLGNGLKVVVREDHRAPVAVVQVWYRVGSSYEPGGITGVSHVLEHMMFKGTRTLGPNEFSLRIAQAGGEDNAFTGSDYTAYFETLGTAQLELALRLEADRMRGLRLDPEELAKELEVVKEERRLRTEDDPNARLYEQFMATAYLSHPYGQPIIGWMADLDALTLEDVRGWYERWYRPGNATLVVVGDVEPQAVFALAQRHFGALPAGAAEPPKPREEPAQQGPRRIELEVPAQVPYVLLGYHVPVLEATPPGDEPYALEVLAGVLAGGESARLPSRLRRGNEVAAQVDAGYQLYARDAGLFLLDGVPAKGKSTVQLERALRREVKALQQAPVSAQELARVKAQVVAGEVFQRDSMFYQAMRIGLPETVGLGWRVAEEYVARIQAVTAAQVQAVARKYLVAENLTVGVLRPKPGAPPPPARPPGGPHRGAES